MQKLLLGILILLVVFIMEICKETLAKKEKMDNFEDFANNLFYENYDMTEDTDDFSDKTESPSVPN